MTEKSINMTAFEFVRKFNKLQEKTCSELIAKIEPGSKVCIYRIEDGGELNLFAYTISYGYWVFVNQEDRVLVTPKTLKLMAKFLKSAYKNARK